MPAISTIELRSFVVIVAMLLAGCAQDADFGRHKPGPLSSLGLFSGSEDPVSSTRYTAEEEQLRRLAKELQSRRRSQGSYTWAAKDFGRGGAGGSGLQIDPPQSYLAGISSVQGDDAGAQVNTVADHMAEETALIRHFTVMASMVSDEDFRRFVAVRDAIERGSYASVTIGDLRTMTERVTATRTVLRETIAVLNQKRDAFAYAVARLSLELPTEAERAGLPDLLAELDYVLAKLAEEEEREDAFVRALHKAAGTEPKDDEFLTPAVAG